jgi:hypothetical protein
MVSTFKPSLPKHLKCANRLIICIWIEVIGWGEDLLKTSNKFFLASGFRLTLNRNNYCYRAHHMFIDSLIGIQKLNNMIQVMNLFFQDNDKIIAVGDF